MLIIGMRWNSMEINNKNIIKSVGLKNILIIMCIMCITLAFWQRY